MTTSRRKLLVASGILATFLGGSALADDNGGGWWHPIHIHLEFMHVLKRNGGLPLPNERDGIAKRDIISLGPNDEVEVFFNFRDFPGRWVMHCHTLEHEDAFMMARFDVVP